MCNCVFAHILTLIPVMLTTFSSRWELVTSVLSNKRLTAPLLTSVKDDNSLFIDAFAGL